MIWAITIVLVSVLAIMYAFLKMTEECGQALEIAGDQYQVFNEEGKVVAEFDTDWLAEAYIDDHYPEVLYISYPEERYAVALKRIRQQ